MKESIFIIECTFAAEFECVKIRHGQKGTLLFAGNVEDAKAYLDKFFNEMKGIKNEEQDSNNS